MLLGALLAAPVLLIVPAVVTWNAGRVCGLRSVSVLLGVLTSAMALAAIVVTCV